MVDARKADYGLCAVVYNLLQQEEKDMVLPDYWLKRPAGNLDNQARSEFDLLLTRIKSGGTNALIEYKIPTPRWQFLCHIAEHHGIALHGTGDPNIKIFEPRKSDDLNPFGNRKAVYAAGDGLWSMFYAVIDRDRYPMSLNNACIRLADASGYVSEPRYMFSISQTALRQRPWRTGIVYLLPADTFEAMPPQPFGSYQILVPQLASLEPVTPLARLEVAPEDFPFLNEIMGHEDSRMEEYARAMMTGGPWPDSPPVRPA